MTGTRVMRSTLGILVPLTLLHSWVLMLLLLMVGRVRGMLLLRAMRVIILMLLVWRLRNSWPVERPWIRLALVTAATKCKKRHYHHSGNDTNHCQCDS